MSFVMAGTVQLTVTTDDGSLAEVGTVEAGGVIGQATLIRQPIPGSMYAREEVTLIYVDRGAVERVVHSSSELLHEFGRSIEERRVQALQVLSSASTDGDVP